MSDTNAIIDRCIEVVRSTDPEALQVSDIREMFAARLNALKMPPDLGRAGAPAVLFTRDEWFRLPLKLRVQWWRETDYGRVAPSEELKAAVVDAMSGGAG